MKNILRKTQQKIYTIFQTLKAYASKLHISLFVGGQFNRRHINEIKEPMTLCIAWKSGNNVQFWSDSRLNYNSLPPIDMAVKVVSFPVKIHEINRTYIEGYFYENSWGICFAGGGQTIYYIKDFIIENLQNLEFSSELFDLSANRIANYINKIYELACNKFIQFLNERNGGCILLTTGLCPKDLRFKTFKYLIKKDDITKKYVSNVEEILLNEEYCFIGSGRNVAQKIYDSGIKDPYKIMKKIIEENLEPTVGGQIQFGENVSINFKVKGVAKIEDNRTITQLRGVDLYDVNLFDYTQDLKPTTSFLINFKEIK